MAGQLEASGAAAEGAGTSLYIKTIPYMLYAWIAVFIVPLFILRIIPVFGPMKKAELRAETTGQTHPDSMFGKKHANDSVEIKSMPHAWNFIVPMILLITGTIYFEDMLYGVIISIVTCIVMFLVQKVMPPKKICDHIINGFKDMIFALMIVVAAFILQHVNDSLGLTAFVIESVKPILSPVLLPGIIFIIIGLLAFCTGSFWGVAAISFPIIVPLAQVMNVNTLLACGAVISGIVFGSHTCFYSDAATLTCASTEIFNIDYAKNVLPLIIIPFALGVVAFLIAGFALA